MIPGEDEEEMKKGVRVALLFLIVIPCLLLSNYVAQSIETGVKRTEESPFK